MKPSTKFNILMLIGCAFMMLGVFAKPLSIPSSFEVIPNLIGIVFFFLAYRVSKKAKTTGQTPLFPAPSESQKRKKLGLMLVSGAVVCIAAPFWLPSTGVSLPFGELVIISILSFFIGVGAVWLGMKMRT
jgi:asparagine N-glycosylation enzyme membrane subunit Stt3